MGWRAMTLRKPTDTIESLLQAWLDWGNTYAMFVSENQEFIDLMIRTQTLLKNTESEV